MASNMAYELWKVWKYLFLLFILLHVYLLIGMFVFHFLEMTHEDDIRKDTRKFKAQMLNDYNCLDHESLEQLIDIVAKAINNGVNPANNATSPSNWQYSGAFFFAGTIITTIGYGHISPGTVGGRAFTVFYALIGIPIFAFFITECGRKLYKGKTWIQDKFNKKFPKKWHQLSFVGIVTMGLGFVSCVLIPSIILSEIEGWLYRDAVYYCFITLTTVGFGDFVAGQNADITYPGIYKVLVFYWIMVGLSQVALVIQDISNLMSTTALTIQKEHESKSKEEDENTNNMKAKSKAAKEGDSTTLVSSAV